MIQWLEQDSSLYSVLGFDDIMRFSSDTCFPEASERLTIHILLNVISKNQLAICSTRP